MILTYLTKLLALKLQKDQSLDAEAKKETEVDCAYLWGITDTLKALGLTTLERDKLTWLQRLYCRPSQIKDLKRMINLISPPTSEEAREIQDAVLKANSTKQKLETKEKLETDQEYVKRTCREYMRLRAEFPLL